MAAPAGAGPIGAIPVGIVAASPASCNRVGRAGYSPGEPLPSSLASGSIVNRRSFIIRLATALGSIGVALAAIPFIRSLLPSARARAAGGPVAVDISDLRPGELRSYLWRGYPVFVMHRTDEQIQAIRLSDGRTLDDADASDNQPAYVDPEYRSVDPEYLVLVGNCTHAGCVPRPDQKIGRDLLGDWWPGGFHCPCHDSMYDYAGRVVRGPAPRNLRVPPYHFAANSRLIIGTDARTT